MNEFIQQLSREKERLLSLISSIDNLLSEYSQHSNELTKSAALTNTTAIMAGDDFSRQASADFTKYKGYSLKESVKNVVLGLDRFTKANEILKTLLSIYPEKNSNVYNFQVQVSGILSDLGKSGDIVKYQFSPSKKDTAWGKEEWLNEEDVPKEEFLPKLK